MRKLIFFLILAVLLVNSCGEEVICSTPYSLVKGECCLDDDQNNICDEMEEKRVNEIENVVVGGDMEDKEKVEEIDESEVEEEVSEEIGEETLLEEDIREISVDDDPFIGRENASVVIIEFGDYQDKFSQKFWKEVWPKIKDRYGDSVRYVFRDFPRTSLHAYSKKAAEASECADEQGRYWDYHGKLFENIYHITLSNLKIFAKDIGLDLDRFSLCLDSWRYEEEVRLDFDYGVEKGVNIIPTFFINDERIAGYHDFEFFKEILDNELKFEVKGLYERVKRLSADSTGNGNLIREGVAGLDKDVEVSPYSNNLERVDAFFYLSVEDRNERDNIESKDQAFLNSVIKVVRELKEEEYRVVLKDLMRIGKNYPVFGGVGTGVHVNGNTGFGTNLLPKSWAYAVVHGYADVYKGGELIKENAMMSFVVSQGIRNDSGKLLYEAEENDVEAYLFVFGKYGEKFLSGTGEGFLYVYWPDVNLREG